MRFGAMRVLLDYDSNSDLKDKHKQCLKDISEGIVWGAVIPKK